MTTTNEAIDQALRSGERQRDIVHRLGVPRYTVTRRAKILRDSNKPKPVAAPVNADVRAVIHRSVKTGTMYEMLTLLTRAELEWLRAQTPEGVSLPVIVAAIIRDAANE